MITPSFRCWQDDVFVYVEIRVPHAKLGDMQHDVDGHEFTFYVKPYYLRLTFSHTLVDDGRATAQYDVEREHLTVRLPKEHPGTQFEDLDMITKLLTRRSLVEVVGEQAAPGSMPVDYDQAAPAPFDTPPEQGKSYYGFDQQFTGFFLPLHEEAREVVDVPSPDESTPESRKALRIAEENARFDFEHYSVDYARDEDIKAVLEFQPWYRPLWKQAQARRQGQPPSYSQATAEPNSGVRAPLITVVEPGQPVAPPVHAPQSEVDSFAFTEEETNALMQLPRKNYVLQDPKGVHLTLVELLLAYTYDHITTTGVPTSESGWTITKLASSLSWLERFDSMKDVAVTFYRRVCIYPVFRNWGLAKRCVVDVVMLLQSGRRAVVRALLAVKHILDRSEWYYVLTKLYVDHYLSWVQSASDDALYQLGRELQRTPVGKADTGLPLADAEAYGEDMRAIGQEFPNPMEAARPAMLE